MSIASRYAHMLLNQVIVSIFVHPQHIKITAFLFRFSTMYVYHHFLLQSTSIVDGLHCVHTALSIISSSDASDVLTTDPTTFCNHLYTILGRIAGVGVSNITESDNAVSHLSSIIKAYDRSNTPAAQAVANLVQRSKITESSNKTTCSDETTSVTASISNRISAYEMEHISDTLISCLNMLLVRRKHEVSTNRILAFSKRLSSAALAVVSLELFIYSQCLNIYITYLFRAKFLAWCPI